MYNWSASFTTSCAAKVSKEAQTAPPISTGRMSKEHIGHSRLSSWGVTCNLMLLSIAIPQDCLVNIHISVTLFRAKRVPNTAWGQAVASSRCPGAQSRTGNSQRPEPCNAPLPIRSSDHNTLTVTHVKALSHVWRSGKHW